MTPFPRYRSLWPLLIALALSSAMSVAVLLFRMAYTESITYVFLAWNLFLAWVPLGCATFMWWIDGRHRLAWPLLALLFCTWLIFFPNAPYIVTDFIHLAPRNGIPLWYDAMLLFSFAWNGLMVGLASLWIVHHLAARWWGRRLSWLMVWFTLAAGGFGVYIGRFLRWNSWDLLTEPEGLVLDIVDHLANPLAHPRTMAVTLFFAAFLTLAYLTVSLLFSTHWETDGESRAAGR